MTSPAEDDSSIVTSPSDQVTAVTPVSTPYDRAVKIPRLWKTTYVFPDASTSISQAHKDRYPVLKDILQRNIEGSPQLCDYTTCISYELRMCGSCVADAIPSILVFCPFGKLKKIKSLLQQPHIRSQFEPETTTSEFVNFGLFFWARKIDMLAFHEIVAVIPAEQATGGVVANATGVRAPWGLRIYNGENGEMNTATMGCMIQVGRDQFGLTTAHAFHQPLATTCGPDDSDSDDEEYDMSMEHDDHSEVTMDVQPALPIDGRGQTVQFGECEVHIPPRDDSSAWIKEHANLDWALLKMGSEKSRLSVYATATEALPIVDRLPQECVDVLIVTTSLHEIPAILYHIPSYIGGAKGSQAAEVWTVGSLSNQTRKCHNLEDLSLLPGIVSQTLRLRVVLLAIRRGDSGSIVVDARSGELYGMVVAANPFGDIHIAPFAAILAQVKELFEVQDALVLNPRLSLTSSVLGPSLGTDSLVEARNSQDVVVYESEETIGRETSGPYFMEEELLPEADPLILHESDRGMLEWPWNDSLRLLPFPQAKERTAKPPTTNPKMNLAGSMTTGQTTIEDGLSPPQLHTADVEDVQSYSLTGLTFSSVEDGPHLPHLHTPGVEARLSLPTLNQANVSKMGTESLIRDIRAWINGELTWLRVAAVGEEVSIMPFDGSTTRHSSDGSLDFVFHPAQSSCFERDSLAVGALFNHIPHISTNTSDVEIDGI